MKDFFIKVKNLSIVTIIMSALIGVILLAKPTESISFVSIMCGATLILLGVVSWISYFARERSTLLALLGTVSALVGIIVCVKYQSIITILLFLFGLFITISGIVDLATSFWSRRAGLGFWGVSTFLSIASIALGVIIMINPSQTSAALVRLAGAGLIVYALVDLITFFQVKKAAKSIYDEVKNIDSVIDDINSAPGNEIDSDGKDVD